MQRSGFTLKVGMDLVRAGANPNTKFHRTTFFAEVVLGYWRREFFKNWNAQAETLPHSVLVSELVKLYGARPDSVVCYKEKLIKGNISVYIDGVPHYSIFDLLINENSLRLDLIIQLVELGQKPNYMYHRETGRNLVNLVVCKLVNELTDLNLRTENTNLLIEKHFAFIKELVEVHGLHIDNSDRERFTALQRVMELTEAQDRLNILLGKSNMSFKIDIAMRLVRLGANPDTRIVNSLIRFIDKYNVEGQYNAYIQELLEKYHAKDDRKDPVAVFLDEYMKIQGITENAAVLKRLILEKTHMVKALTNMSNYDKSKTILLTAKNRETLLGKIFSAASPEAPNAIDEAALKNVQQALDQIAPSNNFALHDMIDILRQFIRE